jgi:hypothetical protein
MKLLIFQYVDPGTGSLLMQLLFSFLIGVGFYLVTLRHRLIGFFKRQPPDKPAAAPTPTGENEPKGD